MKLGYLIPEFPGQTHAWIWREIVQLRRWRVLIRIFSTRRPPERDRARHVFAAGAEAETAYLWPLRPQSALGAVLWASKTVPNGLLRCLSLVQTLPIHDRHRRVRLLALLVLACELARRCHHEGITRLHSHSCGRSAVLCMFVKRLLGIPYSLTLNAKIGWWGGAMREKLSDADFTNTHARWLLEEVRREFPSLAPGQTLLARIGVDTDVWFPRHRVPSSDGDARVITVARLERLKAHDVLLQSIDILRREGLRLSVRFVGDGPQRPELERQVRRLQLEASVSFTGSLGEDRIIELMTESDIFALVGRFEALGVAYMEAMAMELATIGTTAGGVREIIDDGVDGLLVPPDDPRALADALARLVRDPDLRVRMGKAARRKIVERFDSRIGAAILHERLLGKRPPGTSNSAPAASAGSA